MRKHSISSEHLWHFLFLMRQSHGGEWHTFTVVYREQMTIFIWKIKKSNLGIGFYASQVTALVTPSSICKVWDFLFISHEIIKFTEKRLNYWFVIEPQYNVGTWIHHFSSSVSIHSRFPRIRCIILPCSYHKSLNIIIQL